LDNQEGSFKFDHGECRSCFEWECVDWFTRFGFTVWRREQREPYW
jgi:hypothetical protein